MVATTGMSPWARRRCRIEGSTTSTSPTNPRAASRAVAVIMLASSPDRPTASDPCTFMADTISRLTLPMRTMLAISSVSASVTRIPSTELRHLAEPGHELADLRAAAVDDHRQHADRAHEHDVLGERRQRLGSRASSPAVIGSPSTGASTLPPYLMTTTFPQKRRM